jgi:hypothetical protein
MTMKRIFAGVAAVALAGVSMIVANGTVRADKDKAPPAAAGAPDPAMIKRGAYLVMVIGCGDCHTPMKMTPNGPAPDMDKFLSGHPEGAPEPQGTLGKGDMIIAGTDLTVMKFPFGTVYTRNLTPDKTGLGEWTEAQFIKTLRTGHHQGDGRALLPPMPWMNFSLMTDEDLKAVWAFLHNAVKPIKNTVPDPKVPPAVLDGFAKSNAAVQAEMDKVRAGMSK